MTSNMRLLALAAAGLFGFMANPQAMTSKAMPGVVEPRLRQSKQPAAARRILRRDPLGLPQASAANRRAEQARLHQVQEPRQASRRQQGEIMFRNLRLLRLPNGISATPEQLAEQLAKRAFQACGANDRFSHGWVEPHADTGLVYAQVQQRLLCFQSEDKILPSSYVRRCAQAKAEQIEEAQGYKPGRKQMREITELVEAELLPRAFTKLSRSMVWIDNARGWFAVDGSASPHKEASHA